MNLDRFSKILDKDVTKKGVELLGKYIRKVNTKLYFKYENFFRSYYWKGYTKQPNSVYFLKWFTVEGNGPYQQYKYDMPTITKIPETSHETKAKLCECGFHCSDSYSIDRWRGRGNNKLYVVEMFGNFDIESDTSKIAFTDLRVIQEFNETTTKYYELSEIIKYGEENLNIITKVSIKATPFMRHNGNKITPEDIISEFEKIDGVIVCNFNEIINNLYKVQSPDMINTSLIQYFLNNFKKFNKSFSNTLAHERLIHIRDAQIIKKEKIEKLKTKLKYKLIIPRIDKYTGKPQKKKKGHK